MSEPVAAVKELLRVSDADYERLMKKALGKEPALSGCEGHERGHEALRGMPSEVPGSTLSDLCLTCGKCCRMVVAFFPVSLSISHHDATVAWRKARGIDRVPALDRPGYEAWSIPAVCPHLDEATNKCGIYETRPQVCRDYDGYQHPEVDCAWRKEV